MPKSGDPELAEQKGGDELLRRLLHTPPQPRPHRERETKPGGKPKPAAKLRKRAR